MKRTVTGIAEGIGSGKSTFTDMLKHAYPKQVTVLYHENYYRTHDEIPLQERKWINQEHADPLEIDLLIEQACALKQGSGGFADLRLQAT